MGLRLEEGRLHLCLVWRQAPGVGVPDGPQRRARHSAAPGAAHSACAPGCSAGASPAGVVLSLEPSRCQRRPLPCCLPLGGHLGRRVPEGAAPPLHRHGAQPAWHPAAALLDPSVPALPLNRSPIPPIHRRSVARCQEPSRRAKSSAAARQCVCQESDTAGTASLPREERTPPGSPPGIGDGSPPHIEARSPHPWAPPRCRAPDCALTPVDGKPGKAP